MNIFSFGWQVLVLSVALGICFSRWQHNINAGLFIGLLTVTCGAFLMQIINVVNRFLDIIEKWKHLWQ